MNKYYALRKNLIIWGASLFAIFLVYFAFVFVFKRESMNYILSLLYVFGGLLVLYGAVIQQYIVTRKVVDSVFDIDIPENDKSLFREFLEENKYRLSRIKESHKQYCFYNVASIKRDFALFKMQRDKSVKSGNVPEKEIDICSL